MAYLLATSLGAIMNQSIGSAMGYAPLAVVVGIIAGIALVIRARRAQAQERNIGMSGPYGNSQNMQPEQNPNMLSIGISSLKGMSSTSLMTRQPTQQLQQSAITNNDNKKVDTMANGQSEQPQGATMHLENTVNLPVSIWAANVINTLAKKHKRTETSIIDQLCDYYLQTKNQQGRQQQGGQQGGQPSQTSAIMGRLGGMSHDFMNGQGFWK